MTKLFASILISLSLNSCATQEGSQQETVAEAPPMDTALAGCYMMVIGSDTATLKLSEQVPLTGDLIYNRSEKDDNNGTVSLQRDREYLRGRYTFVSEGKQSIREIVFKTDAGKLYEAYGPIVMKGDTAAFEFPHNVEFESSHPFFKTECK